MRVGIDIENISRMSERLLEKIATAKEREYISSFSEKKKHIASLWCAKEAAVKALGTDLSFLDIEVLHEESGRPRLQLTGKAAERFKELKLSEIELSISHTEDIAIAIVMAK